MAKRARTDLNCPRGQFRSDKQRDRFVEMLVERGPDEFQILMERTKNNSSRKMQIWSVIADELNALPGAKYNVQCWRKVRYACIEIVNLAFPSA